MANLEMHGPYELNEIAINIVVPENIIGNYALGYMNNNIFIVKYVGRSDTDLKKRITDHIGEKTYYTHFKYVEKQTPKEAFLHECKNYHDFHGVEGRLDNKEHPDKPNGIMIACPYCILDKYKN